MKIIVPHEVRTVINSLGNRTIQNSGLRIYTALHFLNERANKHGYFQCPSRYLKKVNSRYQNIIKKFLEADIIRYRKNIKPDPQDIFNTITTKSYSTAWGYCMRYKFLIDTTTGEEMEVDFTHHRVNRWYEIIANSLKEFGEKPFISRDSFGRRVHYPLIKDYKIKLKDKGFYVIDARASHPTLLYLLMKKRGIVDAKYNFTFKNNLDFYQYVSDQLQLPDREAAKNIFKFWANANGYVPDARIFQLFPVASILIKKLKQDNYKDCPAFLQREEANMWIDDLLENIPSEFALPVHDSLIVKEKDFEMVKAYCQSKYPQFIFSTRPL